MWRAKKMQDTKVFSPGTPHSLPKNTHMGGARECLNISNILGITLKPEYILNTKDAVAPFFPFFFLKEAGGFFLLVDLAKQPLGGIVSKMKIANMNAIVTRNFDV